jgi:hypothetical protein
MSTNDADFYQAPRFSPELPASAPPQRGCFFYGCIIASILVVLVMILVGVGGFIVYRLITGVVESYTATTPLELPKVEMPAEQREALKNRVDLFRKAVDAGTPAEPLVLTSDDLNALIDENPDLKGKVYVRVEGDKVKGSVSIPLDALAESPLMTALKGRYLNGEADLGVSLQNGVLIVILDSIEVNNQKAPESAMTELRKQNLAKELYKDPKMAETIGKFESLTIKDGKIIIKVRSRSNATQGSPATRAELPTEVLAPPPSGEPANSSIKNDLPRPKAGLEPVSPEAPVPQS